MNQYKVCVYAICKNEEAFVDGWMDSMSEADLIVVTDTGSADGTVEKLRGRGAVVYPEKVEPWRFDAARNLSLDHVPRDVDICVCTDLDERFVPGWRECLEKAWHRDTTNGRYLYNWSVKPDGTPGVQFNYFKVHARDGYCWKCPVHEYLAHIGGGRENTVAIDGMVLNHYPDVKKSRASYLPLLELAVKESPTDDRMNYYLGREYMFAGRWQDCIDTLKRYLTLPTATWNEERCAAMRWMAVSYYRLSDTKECYRWYYRAIAEAPFLRDPYIDFAKIGYLQKDWPLVFYLAEEALKIQKKSPTYVNAEDSWNSTPYDLGAISCYRLGMYQKSLSYAKSALAFSPADERLKSNLTIIQKKAADAEPGQ